MGAAPGPAQRAEKAYPAGDAAGEGQGAEKQLLPQEGDLVGLEHQHPDQSCQGQQAEKQDEEGEEPHRVVAGTVVYPESGRDGQHPQEKDEGADGQGTVCQQPADRQRKSGRHSQRGGLPGRGRGQRTWPSP